MKKLSMYDYMGALILFTLFSCNKSEQKNTSNLISTTNSIQQIVYKDTIEKKNIANFDVIKVDTVIRNFHILYTIKDNNTIISRQSITSKGDSILLKYADKSVFLDLIWNGQKILSNKEINKKTFKSIISEDEIEQYQFWFFSIKGVENEGVLFNINICIPDTDICYPIELYISNNGDFTMSEIEYNEEGTLPNGAF